MTITIRGGKLIDAETGDELRYSHDFDGHSTCSCGVVLIDEAA